MEENNWVYQHAKYRREYAYLGGIPLDIQSTPLRAVIASGNVKLIAYVLAGRTGIPIPPEDLCVIPDIPTAQYFIDNFTLNHDDGKMCACAAKRGQLEYLQFLRSHGFAWDERTMMSAARNGHVACLAYTIVHGCKRDYTIMYHAVVGGHLECLRILFESASWTERRGTARAIVVLATTSGYIPIMAYLRANIPATILWRNNVCAEAARCGHTHMLAYLRTRIDRGLASEPCQWGDDTYKSAIIANKLDCLKFALEADPQCPVSVDELMTETRLGAFLDASCMIHARTYLLDHNMIDAHRVAIEYLYDEPRIIEHAIKEKKWSKSEMIVRAVSYIRNDSAESFEQIFTCALRDERHIFRELFVCAIEHKSSNCMKFLATCVPYNFENEQYWPKEYIRDMIDARKERMLSFVQLAAGVSL